MDTYASLINSSTSAWTTAQGALDALKAADKNDTTAFSEALMQAQLKVSIATSVEQKASATIDKAFQAHSAVASK